jgi:ubiquinone/menaquinone biosynthesis C-methylase UbiE
VEVRRVDADGRAARGAPFRYGGAMGRRGVRIEDEDRWVFNRLADDYRARPGYPPALLDRLAEIAGGAGCTVVDLGAGTGLVALPLAQKGLRVLAVEPATAMLRVLLAEAATPSVQAVHASAEDTGLPRAVADMAVLAEALQWVDPGAAAREIARLVKPGGAVAIVEATPAPTPFMTGVTALIEAANFKARRSAASAARREQLLAAAGPTLRATETFEHAEVLSPERLDAVLRSLSLVGPALGPVELRELLDEARRLAIRAGGAVWARSVALAWGRLP